jgi:plasmid maintenance system antidote protein VapI
VTLNIEHLRLHRRWPEPAARLSAEQVEAIRREAARRDESQRGLARVYGVHESTVSRIVNGRSWREMLTP